MGRAGRSRPAGRRTRLVVPIAGVAALVLLTGCTGSAGTSGSVAGGTPPSGVAAGTTSGTAPAGASPAGPSTPGRTAAASSSAGGGPTLVVPVTTEVDSGGSRVVVQVSVGGGDPVPVLLDTGSSGLLIDAGSVGSELTTSGTALDESFVGTSTTATLGQATVTIGGISTPEPIGIGVVESSADQSMFSGTKGLLGIATADGPTLDAQAFSPALQLPAPYDEGSALDIAASGAGSWTLGPVTEPPGAVALPFDPVTGSPSSYPDGTPAFAKDFTLCWTVGTAATDCGPTDFDLGSPTIALNATTFASLGAEGSELPPGQPVSMANPERDVLWSFTTGTTVGQDEVTLAPLGGTTSYNTGIGFFTTHWVGYDYPGGRVLVTPKS